MLLGPLSGADHVSAVKIAERHYLTAAHCVNGAIDGDVLDLTDRTPLARMIALNSHGKTYAPKLNKIYLHPSWRKVISKETSPADIAKKVSNEALSDLAVVELEEELKIETTPVLHQRFDLGRSR